jgi:hypothetical protein
VFDQQTWRKVELDAISQNFDFRGLKDHK